MRKLFKSITIALALTLVMSSIALANSNTEYKLVETGYPLVVNGEHYNSPDLPILNYEGNTYVPMKAIGDLLGTPVVWNDLQHRAEITKEIRDEVLRKLSFTADQPEELAKLLTDNKLNVNENIQINLNGKSLQIKEELELDVDSIDLTLNSQGQATIIDLFTDLDPSDYQQKIDKPKKKLKIKLTCCPIGVEIVWESGGISSGNGDGTIGDLDYKELANKEIAFDLVKDRDSISNVLSADHSLLVTQDVTIAYNGKELDYFAHEGIETTYRMDLEQANIKFNDKGEASHIQIQNTPNSDRIEDGSSLALKGKPKLEVYVRCCPLEVGIRIKF